MALKDTARTGRDAVWTRRGIEEFGGGFIGLFLMKLIQKSEEKLARESHEHEKRSSVFDWILKLFD